MIMGMMGNCYMEKSVRNPQKEIIEHIFYGILSTPMLNWKG